MLPRLPGALHLACLVCPLCFGLAGCGALLPKGEATVEAPWASFEEARQAIEAIVPYQTKTEELKALGLDPYTNPNIAILTYAEVLRRFMPGGNIDMESLAPGIRDCIAVREGCRAYEVNQQVIQRKRYGNFWADFLNFRRKTEVTGWRFNAIVVMNNGLVVYKLWGGQPQIHEFEQSNNPLGPLQGAGESAAAAAVQP